jgi:negative regulator of sigma E activity
MNEERDSQLSAMFDGELPAAECELLARRLAKDEQLRGEWHRYALIGAALRVERGVRVDLKVADRVSARLLAEDAPDAAVPAVAVASPSAAASHREPIGWWRPAAGVGIAATVAAVSILWLQQAPGPDQMTASADVASVPATVPTANPTEATAVAAAVPTRASDEPDSYVTPSPSGSAASVASAELANYVVAHSEFSGPLSRRIVLSGLVANDATIDTPPATTEANDAGR